MPAKPAVWDPCSWPLLRCAERERLLDTVMARLGKRVALDYVRLNIVARLA